MTEIEERMSLVRSKLQRLARLQIRVQSEIDQVQAEVTSLAAEVNLVEHVSDAVSGAVLKEMAAAAELRLRVTEESRREESIVKQLAYLLNPGPMLAVDLFERILFLSSDDVVKVIQRRTDLFRVDATGIVSLV